MVAEPNPYDDEALPSLGLPFALQAALLPLPESVTVPPEHRYRTGAGEIVIPEAYLNSLARSIHHLVLIAEAARARRGEPAEDASASTATQDLVLSLLPIYRAAFGRRIAVSRDKDTGRPSGPLVRFLGACLDRLEVNLGDEMLVTLIRAFRRQARTSL